MPLPVGHSMMGYAMYDSLSKDGEGFSWRMAILCMLLANLPDIDFLPGLILGEPNLYHRHYLSHSIGASVLVGAGLAGFFHWRGWGHFKRNFVIFTTAYFSHIFVDFFGVDKTEPLGVPIFWPLTEQAFLAPFSLFMGIKKSGASDSFVQSLFVGHNFIAAMWEFVVLLPVVAMVKLNKKRRRVLAWLVQKF